jgi:hypothetical protein
MIDGGQQAMADVLTSLNRDALKAALNKADYLAPMRCRKPE